MVKHVPGLAQSKSRVRNLMTSQWCLRPPPSSKCEAQWAAGNCAAARAEAWAGARPGRRASGPEPEWAARRVWMGPLKRDTSESFQEWRNSTITITGSRTKIFSESMPGRLKSHFIRWPAGGSLWQLQGLPVPELELRLRLEPCHEMPVSQCSGWLSAV